MILASSYVLVGTIFAFRHQSAVSGARQALVRLVPMIAMPLVPAAYWALGHFLPLPPLSFRMGLLLFCVGALLYSGWEIFVRQSEDR